MVVIRPNDIYGFMVPCHQKVTAASSGGSHVSHTSGTPCAESLRKMRMHNTLTLFDIRVLLYKFAWKGSCREARSFFMDHVDGITGMALVSHAVIHLFTFRINRVFSYSNFVIYEVYEEKN